MEQKGQTLGGKYAETLGTTIIEGDISAETLNYLLKNQIIEATIMNHNLKRVISILAWKLQIEKTNAIIKSDLAQVLQKSVKSLEDFLAKSNTKHQAWKKRVDKLEYEIDQLKQLDFRDSNASFALIRARIRKPINRRSFLKFSKMIPEGKESKISLFQPIRLTNALRIVGPSSKNVEAQQQPQITEEDGEPQVLEMDEEEELKLQQEIDKRYANMISMKKSEYKKLTQKNTIKEATPKAKFVTNAITEAPVSESFAHEYFNKQEANLQEMQIELTWHKTLNDLLLEEIVKTREQANTLQNQMSDIKTSSEQAIQDENKNWQSIINSLKVTINK